MSIENEKFRPSVDANRGNRLLVLEINKILRDELRAQVLSLVNSQEDFEDLVQEVIIKLGKQENLPTEKQQLIAFTYKVAKNLTLDLRRRREVRRKNAAVLKTNPNWKVILSQKDAVKDTLGELDPSLSAILTAHYLEGRTLDELVGKNLGGKIFTSRAGLKRGLRDAKNIFKEKYK